MNYNFFFNKKLEKVKNLWLWISIKINFLYTLTEDLVDRIIMSKYVWKISSYPGCYWFFYLIKKNGLNEKDFLYDFESR